MDKSKQYEFKRFKARGAYGKATKWMMEQDTYTRDELMQYLNDECGKSLKVKEGATISPAGATATILLSPRRSSDRGDCRGSFSNPWGHVAYNNKLPRKEIDGKKMPQEFKFVFRKKSLPKKSHEVRAEKALMSTKRLDNAKDITDNANTGKQKVFRKVDTVVSS